MTITQNKKLEEKLEDIHFLVGLIMEYYEFDERESVQKILNKIQEIYDSEKENTPWGLREIELNLRKLSFYTVNSCHNDLLKITTNKIEQKVQKMEEN